MRRRRPNVPDLYPNEALDFPVVNIADIIRIELDEPLLTNDASPIHGRYAFALVSYDSVIDAALNIMSAVGEGMQKESPHH